MQNAIGSKFTLVRGTPYRVRVTDVEGPAKHCYQCGAKTNRELQGRNVTKSERTVKVPVCEKCEKLAMLAVALFGRAS